MKIIGFECHWAHGTSDDEFLATASEYFIDNFWSKIEGLTVDGEEMASSIFDCPADPRLPVHINLDTEIVVPVAKLLDWNTAPDDFYITFEVE